MDKRTVLTGNRLQTADYRLQAADQDRRTKLKTKGKMKQLVFFLIFLMVIETNSFDFLLL